MTEAEMRDAARICNADFYSDVDLEKAIKALKLVTAFLKARGPYWVLAYNPLSSQLHLMEYLLMKRKAKQRIAQEQENELEQEKALCCHGYMNCVDCDFGNS